jgi:DNA-binding NarL/FixJ family response regulator
VRGSRASGEGGPPEIAGTLTAEESTVKTQVKQILMTLGLRDRVQAVIFVHESGVVSR